MQGKDTAPEWWPEKRWGVQEGRSSLTSASVNEKLCRAVWAGGGWPGGFLSLFRLFKHVLIPGHPSGGRVFRARSRALGRPGAMI